MVGAVVKRGDSISKGTEAEKYRGISTSRNMRGECRAL